jgi:hypothetical protein
LKKDIFALEIDNQYSKIKTEKMCCKGYLTVTGGGLNNPYSAPSFSGIFKVV